MPTMPANVYPTIQQGTDRLYKLRLIAPRGHVVPLDSKMIVFLEKLGYEVVEWTEPKESRQDPDKQIVYISFQPIGSREPSPSGS